MIRPNVFDIRAALLAKHAQHVVLVHFPIALFLSGAGFDFMALWAERTKLKETVSERTTLESAAYANLVAAAVSVLPVVASGIMAWQWQLDGRRLHGVLLLHFALGALSGILIGVIGWIHFRAGRVPSRPLSKYRLPLEFITAVIVIFTAHLGGFLSGVNAPG
ncbi:MAG: DUF2231 domain-containing protein [Terriglobales bacterium]